MASKKEDYEINDLIIAAYAQKKLKQSADELSKITGELNLPVDFNTFQ